MDRVENSMTLKKAKELEIPQCPECSRWNVHVTYGRRVDFYGIPYFWKCPCGWKKEIGEDLYQEEKEVKNED